ncbi:MAG: hypothetical protein ACXVEF_37200 [Polyangiales bacterium]
MTDQVEERLSALHRVACEDALFAVAAVGLDALESFGKRRLAAAEAIARDGLANAVMMADWDAWRIALTKAIAPVQSPWFVPMRDAIDKGLTLEKESRGLRGLIPIGVEAEKARIRRDGAFAVRVARAVSAADGLVSRDEAFAVELLLAALALPEDDQRVLRAEAPVPIAAIDVPSELEPKVARAVVAGAWQTAATDGLDDAEHAAVQAIASRIGVDADGLLEAREVVEKTFTAQRATGAAMIDVVRYVLAPLPAEESTPLALAAIHLAVPPLDREPAIRLVTTNAATPLGRAHDLDRSARTQVLAASWAAALATNPTASSRARLVARHERAASQVGGDRQASDAREKVETYVAKAMARGAAIVGA